MQGVEISPKQVTIVDSILLIVLIMEVKKWQNVYIYSTHVQRGTTAKMLAPCELKPHETCMSAFKDLNLNPSLLISLKAWFDRKGKIKSFYVHERRELFKYITCLLS